MAFIYAGGYTIRKIFKYDPSNMSKVAESPDYGGNLYILTSDGTYVYAGGATPQKVFKYDPSNMSKVAESPAYGSAITALTSDGTYVYAGGATVQKVFKYDPSNMSKVAESPDYGGIIYTLTTDYRPTGGTDLPSVTTGSASSVTVNSATLNGTLIDLGDDDEATVHFEYGKTTSYGSVVHAGTKTTTGTFSANISSLDAGTLYHFRAYATNTNGTTYGEDATFTTEALPEEYSAGIGAIVEAIVGGTGRQQEFGGIGAIVEAIVSGTGEKVTPPITITATQIGNSIHLEWEVE